MSNSSSVQPKSSSSVSASLVPNARQVSILNQFKEGLTARMRAYPIETLVFDPPSNPAQKRKAATKDDPNAKLRKFMFNELAATKKFVTQPMINLPASEYHPIPGRAITAWYTNASVMQKQFGDLLHYLCLKNISKKWNSRNERLFREQLSLKDNPIDKDIIAAHASRLNQLQNIDHVRMHRLTVLSTIMSNLSIAENDEKLWKGTMETDASKPDSNSMKVREARVLFSHLLMHKKIERAEASMRDDKECYTCASALRDGQAKVIRVPNVAADVDKGDPQKTLDFSLCGVCAENFQAWENMLRFYDIVDGQIAQHLKSNPSLASMKPEEFAKHFVDQFSEAAIKSFNSTLTKVITGFGIFMEQMTPDPVARALVLVFGDMFEPSDPRFNPSQKPVAELNEDALAWGDLLKQKNRAELLVSLDHVINQTR